MTTTDAPPLDRRTAQATVALVEALRVLRTTRRSPHVQDALRAEIAHLLSASLRLPDHIPQALVACGDRALLAHVHAHFEAAGMAKTFSSITLGGAQWSGLLEQGLESVIHLLDTDAKPRVVSPKNASLPALEWVVNHPGEPDGDRLLALLARVDHKAYFVLQPTAAGLFFAGRRARVGARFLTQWMVHHAQTAKGLGKNWAGKGNAFGVMALHLAGLPLADMQDWRKTFHPAVAPIFAPTSAHHALALRAHARDLAHLLEHRQAFEAWAQGVLSCAKAPP